MEILSPKQKAALHYAVQARDHLEAKLATCRERNIGKADAMAAMLRAVAETAESYGVVCTMRTEPMHPPVMGKYTIRWDVRPSREMYQEEMKLEAELKLAQEQVDSLIK